VRITHVPTGIQAAIQDERSQHQNRAKALVLVAARVYEQRRAEEDQVRRRHLIDGTSLPASLPASWPYLLNVVVWHSD
jgi:protein subunit release factor A